MLEGKHLVNGWTQTFSDLQWNSTANKYYVAFKTSLAETTWKNNAYPATFLFRKTQGTNFSYTIPITVSLSGYIDYNVSIWLNINSLSGDRLKCYQLPVNLYDPTGGFHDSYADGVVSLTNYVSGSVPNGTTFDFYIGEIGRAHV